MYAAQFESGYIEVDVDLRELTDSTGFALHSQDLIFALLRDGYLFLRGIIEPQIILDARAAVVQQLIRGGWLDTSESIICNPACITKTHPAHISASLTPEFNRIPYCPQLTALVQNIIGSAAFSYPTKLLRTVPREGINFHPGRLIHHDFGYWGVADMVTTWVPLMEIPRALGGLAVLPSSHLGPPQELRPIAASEAREWATADYRVGDVLIFHSLTAHAALPNQLETLRISGDFRWQLPIEPAPLELVIGRNGKEIYADLFERQPWWRPVPPNLLFTHLNRNNTAPPKHSRMFQVHPAWRNWIDPRSELQPRK